MLGAVEIKFWRSSTILSPEQARNLEAASYEAVTQERVFDFDVPKSVLTPSSGATVPAVCGSPLECLLSVATECAPTVADIVLLNIFVIFYFYVYKGFACIQEHVLCMCLVFLKFKKGSQILQNWSCEWLQAAIQVQEPEPRASAEPSLSPCGHHSNRSNCILRGGRRGSGLNGDLMVGQQGESWLLTVPSVLLAREGGRGWYHWAVGGLSAKPWSS